MVPLNSWAIAGNIKAFREGVSAYRNARDWAKEQRGKFIKEANEIYIQAQLPDRPSSESSERTAVVDDVETWTVPDSLESQDAAQQSPASRFLGTLEGHGDRDSKEIASRFSANHTRKSWRY